MAISLVADPKFDILGKDNKPAVGWKIYTYEPGTLINKATYTDATGGVANTNPVILDARGEADIWWDGSYKIVVKDENDVTIWSLDNYSNNSILNTYDATSDPTINDDTSEGYSVGSIIVNISTDGVFICIDSTVGAAVWSSLNIINGWVSTTRIPSFLTATTFTLTGDQTALFHVGRRLKTQNTSGAIYSTIVASVYTSFTTITLVNDSGSLDSGLSAASYGVIGALNTSDPAGTKYGSHTFNNDITLNAIIRHSKGVDLTTADVTAGALALGSDGNMFDFTGTDTITSIDSVGAGAKIFLQFDAAAVLTHHATNLILNNNGGNITTEAGGTLMLFEYAVGQWIGIYTKPDGSPLGAPSAAQGSSLVLLASATASADATIEFTGIDNTYEQYIVKFSKVVPAVDNSFLRMRTSTNGGSSYDSGATDYAYTCRGYTSDGALISVNSAGEAFMTLTADGVGSASGESLSGEVTIHAPSNTAVHVLASGRGVLKESDTGKTVVYKSGGARLTNDDVDAIQLYLSAGNIASGEFRLYGIKDA